MMKYCVHFIILVLLAGRVYAQFNESGSSTGFMVRDSISMQKILKDAELNRYIEQNSAMGEGIVIGGSISSIFHEVIDSAILNIYANGTAIQTALCTKGLFILSSVSVGSLVDIRVLHPEFHVFDTSFIVGHTNPIVLNFQLVPKYKILVRGRVFSGNLPLDGTNVKVSYGEKQYNLLTRSCYYDEENYWNCLYNGMFKVDLIADNPEDSIRFMLTKSGMKSLEFTMRFKDYTGEIMKLKMRYNNKLPSIPLNEVSLKLSFPVLSSDEDWFVDISYYRLINETNLRRFALGLDANMFITNVTSEIETLDGLEPSGYDSSYVSATIGPSLLFWFIPPDNRKFGSYAGCLFAWNIGRPEIVFQPFIGTRYFLDQNKAFSLELRYAELQDDIYQYEFNYYGNAYRSSATQTFKKFHLNFGIQVVF